jgi:hypothetical protein
MVYGFVKQSSGHLDIISEEGKGTCVRLLLPRAEEGARTAPSPTRVSPLVQAKGERILAVEEQPEVRELSAKLLTGLGYNVETVASGEQALEMLSGDGNFDLLFSGLALSGERNGVQLADEATNLRPQMKVLLMSGGSEDVPTSTDREMNWPLIHKPFHKAELADRLSRLLGAL